MKRLLKQSICLLAILCLFAGLVPVQAQAYEKKGKYKIHSMREDKWITSPKDDSDDYYHVYKFKISTCTVQIPVYNPHAAAMPQLPSQGLMSLY